MPQPLLDFLTGRARAALPFLRGLVKTDLNNNQIIAALRELTPTFQRQAMLDVIAALKGNASVERWLRIVPANIPLPVESHTVSVVNLSNNYQYVLLLQNEPETLPEYITVSSSVPLSQNEIYDRAILTLQSGHSGTATEQELAAIQLSIEEINVSPSAPLP